MKFVAITFLCAWSFAAPAKVFKNSYLSFELPDNWSCAQEEYVWTCSPLQQAGSTDATGSREAVIILAAKVAGPEDNLETFLSVLKTPKKIVTAVGTPMPSQVMTASERSLAGQRWIQAQHLGSEIKDYYTLYLATVKEKLAILISFSADKNRYSKYNPIFETAIRSIQIIASRQLLLPNTRVAQAEPIGIQLPADQSATPAVEGAAAVPRAKFKYGLISMILVGFALAAVTAIFMFKKNSRKISSNKRQRSRTK